MTPSPIYGHQSPSQSTTSLSDVESDDLNDTKPLASYPFDIVPARWSHDSTAVARRRAPSSGSKASSLPPEILIHVLRQLQSPRDLYRVLQVCRLWCECAVELLWHKPAFTKINNLFRMVHVLSRHDQTFNYSGFIRRLNLLSVAPELTDQLFSRLSLCTRIERLTLVNAVGVTDDGLARVLMECTNLVALDLTNVVDVTDKSIITLATHARKLQGVNLGGCKKVTDVGIKALASRCALLRRIKLSGVEAITDDALFALAELCPLLLEIDLNHCPHITDVSVRELWTRSVHLRELRLAHCVELTDAAFPAPGHPLDLPSDMTETLLTGQSLPPLYLSRPLEHLRMLDLTSCTLITDEAIEGIVSHAPKVRNLVLAKCGNITDKAVLSICKLGKSLHYLHLGHATSITDNSIKTLARSCTRLRYIDLACCELLTDMSVFELAGLPKLRRIGLVRVPSLTDQAIFALADRYSTLERIHLSYCANITVMAIHFLLTRLTRLTHLSLTGIPAFKRAELQQFCREPPKEFNPSQRAAFCVYSGNGVAELRRYLCDIMASLTDDARTGDDTEEDDFDDLPATQYTLGRLSNMRINAQENFDDTQGPANYGLGGRFREEQPSNFGLRPATSSQPRRRLPVHILNPRTAAHRLALHDTETPASSTTTTPSPSAQPSETLRHNSWTQLRARANSSDNSGSTIRLSSPLAVGSSGSVFGSQNRVLHNATFGSNHSHVLTPELRNAEAGHAGVPSPAEFSTSTFPTPLNGRPFGGTSSGYPFPQEPMTFGLRTSYVRTASSTHNQSSQATPGSSRARADPRMVRDFPIAEPSSTPSSPRGSPSPGSGSEREENGRGRRVRRGFRNTLSAAEQYANSVLFGRSSAQDPLSSSSSANPHAAGPSRANR